MSTMSCFYPTFVCWDMNDYPPPKDLHPHLIYHTILSSVQNVGFFCHLEIRGYCHESTVNFARYKLRMVEDSGMLICYAEKKLARVNRMLFDLVLSALNTRKPENFLVITTISEHTEYLIRDLLSLKARGSPVYLALPKMHIPKRVTGIESLTRRNVPFLKLTHAAPGHNKIQVWLCSKLFEEHKEEEEEEEEEEDYPLPAHLDSCSFYDNIKSFLAGKDVHGDLFIWAYVPGDDVSLLPLNCGDLDSRFTLVPKVPRDKYARLNKMTFDLLLWALDNPVQRPCGPNLLVISKNMEESTGIKPFYSTLGGLTSREYTVHLALPDTDNVAPEKAPEVTSVLPWKSLSGTQQPGEYKRRI